MKYRILLIDDDENFYNSLRLMLRPHPIEIEWAATGAMGIQAYRKNIHGFAVVLIDYILPDLKGTDVAVHIRKLSPVQNYLFASGHRDPSYLLDQLKTGGACGFIEKGLSVEEVLSPILDSISHYESHNRVIGFDSYSPSQAELDLKSEGLIGRSAAMHQVILAARKYRSLSRNVVLIGENGAGKERLAKVLCPKGKELIPVNCPRYSQSENLLEAELFGVTKGSFTGADRDKPGLLANAHRQVVFFDELQELSLVAQTKLLRLIQEKKYRRVGDNERNEISVEFNIIATVKPDIWDRVADGSFKEDLFQRVGQLEIVVPPLRERPDDIEPLTRYYQDKFNEGLPPELQRQVRISAINEMKKYSWTGNVRELENIVTRMLADATGDIVGPSDFEAAISSAKKKHVDPLRTQDGLSLDESLKRFETEKIITELKKSRTQVETASRLGIEAPTLNKKLVRLGIRADSYLMKTR